ncbi:MAG: hypothetical protein HYZ72_11020 [Deltaproteobacteria bacterium]|nr:hypothetical protein [Deltaproteobacteria bacterium]
MSPSDAAPHYQIRDNDLEEEPDQERTTFLQRHWGHPLAPLKRKNDRFYADRPVWDPFRRAYEEVSDGQETFLLKSWRTKISAPRQYTLLRGSLDMTITVLLREEPLRNTLAHSFPCSAAQLDGLVKALQHTVATLPPAELIPAYCSADDSQLSFAYLSEHHLGMLVRRCSEAGLSTERTRLWNFFAKNQQEEELTVELRQYCRPNFS